MKKKLIIIITSIILGISIFIGIWFLGDNYSEFYNISNKEYKIPGLDEKFRPQGLCHYDNIVLLSGYMTDSTSSRIYVINKDTKEIIKYFILGYDGKDYIDHAGGIETDGYNVFIASSGFIYNFLYEDIDKVKNKEKIHLKSKKKINNGADFLEIYNDELYVGEFYRKGNYETPSNHRINDNTAVTYVFKIDKNKDVGIDDEPVKAISTIGLVQGMVINDDNITLSTSYGLADSNIYFYKNILNETSEKIKYNDKDIPLYILDNSKLIKSIKSPCMSEEIELIDGRIHILYESAADLYKIFTREKLYNVYSIPVL